MQAQQPIQVQADQQITITLQAQFWSQIITVLQEAPISWRVAQPLIQMLGEQLQQATMQPPMPGNPLPNGSDEPRMPQ